MKNVRKELSLILLSSALVITGCGKKDKIVLEKGKLTDQTQEDKRYVLEEASLYRDIKKGNKITIADKNSWYSENILSDRARISYSELKNAIENMEKEVIFSKGVSENEFHKVMNIIYFDTPESFALKYQYQYELDENQNVKKAKLDYVIDKKLYKDIIEEFNSKKNKSIKASRGMTDIEAVNSISDEIKDRIKLIEKEQRKGKPMNNFSTIMCDYNKNGATSLGISSLVIRKFRDIGLDCFVKVGSITDAGLHESSKELKNKDPKDLKKIKESIDPSTFKNSDITKYKDVKKKDKVTTVSIHPEYMHSWVMVKVDGKWLNVDPYYDFVANIYRNTKKSTCTLSPDFLLAESRNFSNNEDLFGVVPTCEDINYLKSVKDKALVLHKNKQEMAEYLKKEMEENVKSKRKEYYHQFVDKETMLLYLREFENAYEESNKISENAMTYYVMEIDKSRNLVEIQEIKYSI